MQATGINRRVQVRVTLCDGSPALLRPVVPDDRLRIAIGMAELSLHSRCFRFFVPVRSLSEEQLRYFTEVDQYSHVAWIAVDPSLPGQPGLGIGRFVRLDGQPSVAEFAVTVVDAHQGKGLGTHLLALLCLLAQERGVRVLHGVALPENHRVTDWLARLGAARRYCDGVCHLELPLPEDVVRLPPNATSRRFQSVVTQLRREFAAWG
ncbi:MAG: GNAT family N-acetyltransferase [Limisphaerales bacterium]